MSLTLLKSEPFRCSRNHEALCPLEWRPERSYPAGTEFEIRMNDLRSFVSWRFCRATMQDADITWRWPVNPTVGKKLTNREMTLVRFRLQYGVNLGQVIPIDTVFVPAMWAGLDMTLSLWVHELPHAFFSAGDEKVVFTQEANSNCVLPLVADVVERMGVYAQPAPGTDGQVRVVICPLDGCGNPARFGKPVEARIGWGEADQTVSVEGVTTLDLSPPPESIGRVKVCIPQTSLGLEENIINACFQGDDLVMESNPVWTDLPGNLLPAFGDIHWHTDVSGDGQRTIAEALRCSKEELNHDFAAPSDHNPNAEGWKQTVKALDAVNEPGRYAAIYGWENSVNVGHENYYFTDPDHPLVCNGSEGYYGGRGDEDRDIIGRQKDLLAVPHHTNAVSESRHPESDAPFWHPYPWNEQTPCHRLVEIFQTRGNQECNEYSDAWLGWYQHNGASVQDALERGYRIGFTGGTDNHCGWPGRAFAETEGGGTMPGWTQVLTGVWTSAIERQSVWDALFARHTWAVINTRALVWFTVNETLAGDEVSVDAGTPLTARIRLSAQAPLQSVEIVSEGKTVWADSCASLDMDVTADLGKADRTTHFYLRARQRDGGLIYASPVFVDVKCD